MENKTHWLQSPNKNYLGHWDLPDGNDLILTIESAKWEEVKNPIINTVEAKRVVRFKEDVKPFICNQGNAQSILKATGVKFMDDSKGQRIQLYVGIHKDTRSKENIDCIRIRPIKPVLTKPELTPKHERWNEAKTAIKEGKKDGVLKVFTISDVNLKLIEE